MGSFALLLFGFLFCLNITTGQGKFVIIDILLFKKIDLNLCFLGLTCWTCTNAASNAECLGGGKSSYCRGSNMVSTLRLF